MKRNDIIILLSTACFSFLFYHQLLGINLFVFNILLIMILLFRDASLLKSKSFLLAAALSLISSFACFLNNHDLSISMNIISLLIISATAMNKENSIIANFFHGIYSQITVLGYFIYDLFKKEEKTAIEEEKKSVFIKKILLTILPLLVFFIFFFLYRQSNTAFKMLTDQINIDFISLPWIGFTMLGFFLLYAFFIPRTIPYLKDKDFIKKDDLFDKYGDEHSDWFQKFMSFKSEILTGIILFSLINILTLSVNVTDIIYTWSTNELPKGLTFSEYIHSGIASLITSILLAMVIILFYFRGALNYYKSNKIIKTLAYLWIIQNIFLVASTILRNKMYVDTYSLTEKRVGVFIYLALCIAGLFLCFYKIFFKKNNVFLIRKNIWVIYIILCIFSIIDWSKLISKYNIYRAKKTNNFYLDVNYMGQLNENNFEAVWKYYSQLSDNDFRKPILKNILDKKLNTILLKHYSHDFRSISYQRMHLYQFIKSETINKQITSLNAFALNIKELSYLKDLKYIEKFDLSNNTLSNIIDLNNFIHLKSLNLSGNNLDSITNFPNLPQLTDLNVSSTRIENLNLLSKYHQLENLDISSNNLYSIENIQQFQNLQSLNISNNQIDDYSKLNQLPYLKKLYINNIYSNEVPLPYLTSLENLEISGTFNTALDVSKFLDFDLLMKLKELKIKNGDINNTSLFTSLASNNQLEKLDISSNKITKINSFTNLHQLKELDISDNNLYTEVLDLPNSIENLSLRNTNLLNFSFFNQIANLKYLDLSNNNILFSEIYNLPKLEQLMVNNCNSIQFIEFLNMPQLKHLYIKLSTVSNYQFIKSCPKLESIEISNIDKELGAVLLGMKHLKKIECYTIDENIYNQLISNNPGIYIIKNDDWRNRISETSASSY